MPAYRLLLASLLLGSLLLACGSRAPQIIGETTTSTGRPVEQVAMKPRPQVLSITASTSGNASDYYVIVDANVKNEGAEGVVNVVASVTQAGTSSTKETPVTLARGAAQNVRFVFPIKWKGGDWVPKVSTEVP